MLRTSLEGRNGGDLIAKLAEIRLVCMYSVCGIVQKRHVRGGEFCSDMSLVRSSQSIRPQLPTNV